LLHTNSSGGCPIGLIWWQTVVRPGRAADSLEAADLALDWMGACGL